MPIIFIVNKWKCVLSVMVVNETTSFPFEISVLVYTIGGVLAGGKPCSRCS